MNVFYYIEVNLICVIFLAFINRKISQHTHIGVGEKFFLFSIQASEWMCIADAVAGVFNGKDFYSARFFLETANMIYFIVGTLTAACWLYYVCLKFRVSITKFTRILIWVPFAITFILTVTNPLTGFIYYIDDSNEYSRGSLLYIYWFVVFIYLMVATIISIKMTKKEYNKVVREANISFCLFGVFPTLGFLIQILLYGTTTISVGIALGYLFYYVRSLEAQVSEDILTGLNNRKQFDRYITDLIHKKTENPIFFIMMDIKDFRLINNEFGHTAGDEALQYFSKALKTSSRYWHGNYLMCRYGGDEFAVIGELMPGSDLESLVKIIRNNIEEVKKEYNCKYKLEASFGFSYSICNSTEDFVRLQKEVDEQMAGNDFI